MSSVIVHDKLQYTAHQHTSSCFLCVVSISCLHTCSCTVHLNEELNTHYTTVGIVCDTPQCITKSNSTYICFNQCSFPLLTPNFGQLATNTTTWQFTTWSRQFARIHYKYRYLQQLFLNMLRIMTLFADSEEVLRITEYAIMASMLYTEMPSPSLSVCP